MAKIFSLSADVKAIAQQAIDDLMAPSAEGGLGKECLLIYPPTFVACSNCQIDSFSQKSSNRWVTGGPVFFPDGAVCPVCNGAGKRAEEITDTVTLLVASHPSQFFLKVPAGIQVPDGTIQTKGFLTDLPKVLRAKEMVVQPGVMPTRLRYVMDGEACDVSNIVQGRYWVAFWRRAGG